MDALIHALMTEMAVHHPAPDQAAGSPSPSATGAARSSPAASNAASNPKSAQRVSENEAEAMCDTERPTAQSNGTKIAADEDEDEDDDEEEEVHSLVDLRDEHYFPAYANLRNEYCIGYPVNNANKARTLRPNRHWCLLAEVVRVRKIFNMILTVKDKNGQQFLVYFPDKGSWERFEHIQEGHTVAVMYADKYLALDGNDGVRVDRDSTAKSFPWSLEKMFQLSDEAQKQRDTINGNIPCWTCGSYEESASMCGQCDLYFYCSKECQERAWSNLGHRTQCQKLIQTGAVNFLTAEWQFFRGFRRF